MENNNGGSDLEGVIGKHQKLVEQAGNLVEQAIELERTRIEAQKAKGTQPATTTTPTAQAPLSGGYTGIRDEFRPLEALVQQGPASFGGVEPYRGLVFERISGALGQIYPDLSGNKWDRRRENEGWANNQIYICNRCNAVQRKDTKERLTTPAEYNLISEAFKLAKVYLHEDTASCTGEKEIARREKETAGRETYTQPETPKTETPTKTPPYTPKARPTTTVTREAVDRAGQKRLEEIEALKKSTGGEWYTNKEGGWWNLLYLICLRSEKAYSRQTGEPVNIDVAKVMELLPLSQSENLCPTHPLYPLIAPTLPEAAKVYAPINCSACKAPQR